MAMTPLEAGTACLFHAETLRASSGRRTIPEQSSSDVVALSGAQAKFGSQSLDAYTVNYGGLRFNRGAPFVDGAHMTMECWAYFRSHRALSDVRVMSSYADSNGSVYFGLKTDGSGLPTVEFRDNFNNANPFSGPSAMPLNQWVHLALTCDPARSRRLYVNGTLVAVGGPDITSPGLTPRPDNSFVLGGTGGSNGVSPDAFIDEARYVLNVPVYEVPLAAQSAPWADGSSSDSLLLHGEGSSVTDSSPNGLTASQVGASGTVAPSTTTFRFGSSSLRFPGTRGIAYSASSLFESASRDWTVECQFRVDPGMTALYPVIWQTGTSANDRIVHFFSPAGSTLYLHVYSGGVLRGALVYEGLKPGNWQRSVLSKKGSIYSMWVDGVPVGSTTISSPPTGNLSLCIGWQNFGGGTDDYFAGYIDEFRFSTTARYYLGFTPPVAPFADVVDPTPYAFSGPFRRAGTTVSALTPKFMRTLAKLRDVTYGGRGVISATVKEKASPVNLPLRRRVWLLRERDAAVIRETWSDAVTGNYSFTNIDETQTYTVLSFDHLRNYRATIADNLTPTVP